MKKIVLLTLALMLSMGSALAQGREDVRSELGFCSTDAYEGCSFFCIDQEVFYEMDEYLDAETGLTTWDILWDWGIDGGMGDHFGCKWFRPDGIIAETEYDLDDDGADEWLVVFNRLSKENVEEYPFYKNELMLRVYEQSGSEIRQADEIQLDPVFDFYARFLCLSVAEIDGEATMFFQSAEGVDGYLNRVQEIAYREEKLQPGYACAWEGTDTDRVYEYPGPEDTDPVLEPDEDGERKWSYDFSTKNIDEGLAVWDECMAHMGLYPNPDDEFGIVEALAEDRVVLFRADIRGQLNAENKPVIRLQMALPGNFLTATASVNLRTEPNLEGEIIDSVESDTQLLFAGEEAADDRGVVWYKVEYRGNDAWVSSKYVQ